ncbi:DUF4158 domain-containing protein (plasmid) [Hymenobacter sp. BRD67]|nr:DUF4158 domain-containing protein [Hymenobacter sp. BRD67]QKG55132.1 DUF4158 domain-containing protein [Hymenobacter sp. BRD67]
MRQHGYLSPADLAFVRTQRRDVNRLGCAVQLVVLRVFAHLPERWWRQVPANLLDFAAAQLALDGAAFTVYGQREATVYEHCQAVLLHLGWRRCSTRPHSSTGCWSEPWNTTRNAYCWSWPANACANSSWCAPPWSNSSA